MCPCGKLLCKIQFYSYTLLSLISRRKINESIRYLAICLTEGLLNRRGGKGSRLPFVSWRVRTWTGYGWQVPFYERNLKTTSGTDTWQAGWFILALLSTLKDLLCEWFFGALNMVRGINDYPPPLHFQSSALREGVCLVGSGEEGGREEAGAREQWACCGGELSLSPCTHTAALIPQSLTPTLSGNRCVSGNLCLRHSKSHSLSLSYCIYCLLCMATGTTFNLVLN